MKKTLLYIAVMLLSVVGLSSCDGEMAQPPMVYPDASPEFVDAVNTTIAQLKQMYYSADQKSYQVVGTNENGEDIYIRGRIISSTEAGNIYKCFYVADETAAICVRVNSSKVYQLFQYGQEVIVKCTGLGIGNYGGMLQLGGAENNGSPNTIESDDFDTYINAFGMPEPSKVEPVNVTVGELRNILKSAEQTLMWQGKLVRIADVSFDGAGVLPFADKSSTYNTSRYFGNDEGKLLLYNSPYATFAERGLPVGTGSVTGVLSYYASSGWQVLINSIDDLQGFDEIPEKPAEIPEAAPEGDGTLANPYNVAKAIEVLDKGEYTTDKVYVKGKVCNITSIDVSGYGNATYYISDSGYDVNSLEVYRGYSLGGNKFKDANEIKEGDEVIVYGVITVYNGTKEFTTGSQIYSVNGQTSGGGNTGGGDTGATAAPSGDGTEANPYNVAKALEIIKSGAMTDSEVYITGTISEVKEISTQYGNGTYYIYDEGFPGTTFTIFRGYYLDGAKFTSTDQLSAGMKVVVKGKLILYNSTPEMAQGNSIVKFL